MIIYERPDIHRVNVRGSSDRYIEKKKVNRRYSAGRRGIAPSTTTLSPSQTNCTSFAGAISCKTTPGQSIQSSGVSSIPPGVQQFTFSTILDCKDKTFAEYVTPPGSLNPYMLEKWKKAKPSSTEDLILKRSCPKIPALKLSSFTKLSWTISALKLLFLIWWKTNHSHQNGSSKPWLCLLLLGWRFHWLQESLGSSRMSWGDLQLLSEVAKSWAFSI